MGLSTLSNIAVPLSNCLSRRVVPLRACTFRSEAHDAPSEEDQKAARQWLAGLNANTVPRSICQTSFSRSSGPGLLPLVPSLLHEQLQKSRYCASKSNSLLLSSDSGRKQADNLRECFDKLQDLLATAGRNAIKGETSPAQVAKVKNLWVLTSMMF